MGFLFLALFHFHLIHSKVSRPRSERKSDFNFYHATTRTTAASIAKEKPRLFEDKSKIYIKRKSYYFNGKYWRKIVFMFIVMQKKRFFPFHRGFHSSFFFLLLPKLLFIIIFSIFFSPCEMGFNFFPRSLFGMSEEFMCAVKEGKASF